MHTLKYLHIKSGHPDLHIKSLLFVSY